MSTLEDVHKGIMEVYKQLQSVIEDMQSLTDSDGLYFSPLYNATYCIDEQVECNIYDVYDDMAEWAKQHGYTAVYDIGCSCGFQGDCFKARGIQYDGIDMAYSPRYVYKNAWNKYHFNEYPFDIKPVPNSIAISDFCIGYFGNDEAKAKQLAKEFDTVLIGYTNVGMIYSVYGKYFDVNPVKGLHSEFFLLKRRE